MFFLAFKDGGETLPKIQLVDVYELLCKVRNPVFIII